MKRKKSFWNMFVAMTSVLMMTVIGACTIYAAEEGGSAEVNVQTKVSGTAPEKEVFTYTLKDQGASDNQERKLTVEGAGTGTFLLHYTQPGVYSYILKQESGTKADWTYDSEVYYVDVYVMWDEKMESLETVTVYFDSEGNKSEPVFENKYQQPEKRTQAVVKKVRSAKTGDEDILSGWAVLMILAAGTGVLAYRKKATRQRKS